MPFTRLKVLWNAIAYYCDCCFISNRCQHPKWRPAISDHAPAKWCSQCGVVINVKEVEFYALFGRPSYTPNETPLDPMREHK